MCEEPALSNVMPNGPSVMADETKGQTEHAHEHETEAHDGALNPDSIPSGINYTIASCRGQWAYMQDEGTTYVTKGYRIGLSAGQCVYSMFQIHNETVNVWSHLVGFLMFISLCFYVLWHPALHLNPNSPIARKPVPECLPHSAFVVGNDMGSEDIYAGIPSDAGDGVCIRADEKHAWRVSHTHFAVARDILQHVKRKLPGLEEWKSVFESHTKNMQKNMKEEAAILQQKLDQAINMLDRSVEKIKEDLAYLSSASMEGCLTCWADLVQNLHLSRESLLDQLASVRKMSHGLSQNGSQTSWGLSTAEWADFTAMEIKSVAQSLNGGISAAKKALVHASHNLHDEVLHELDVLKNMDLLPKDVSMHLERWPIVVFLMSACFCLLTSASYHLFNCHSRTLNDVLLLMDYVGISVLIAGSYYPPIYYGFYCDTLLARLYLTAVSVLSVASSIVGVYSGLYPSHFWKIVRVLCYSANACFGLLPCGHLLFKYLAGEPSWSMCLAYIAGMLSIYGVGTVIYVMQFPERFWPGKFDFFFSSHQLWHILVFLAAYLHYFCAIGHFQWRSHTYCPAPL